MTDKPAPVLSKSVMKRIAAQSAPVPAHKDHMDNATSGTLPEQKSAPVARTAKQRRKRMHNIVAAMQQYVAGYDKQPHYEDYSDETFISDMLYGIGIALDGERYSFAGGFREWKLALRERLNDEPRPAASVSTPDNAEAK